ncbi:hypothetical protein LTR04_001278 [Oleoguttula sp. CCFEE 6159]|nr:hypothetical protein LTR04_001278 [Oleoguttula sp. CCFEE 6159]
MDTRTADPETQLDVDVMILDYLLYNATKALLDERNAQRQSIVLPDHAGAELLTNMVDSFLPIFRSNHPTFTAPASLQFRLRLLKVAALFTRRLTACTTTPPAPTLRELRRRNGERARTWQTYSQQPHTEPAGQFTSELPLPSEALHRNRRNVLWQLGSGESSDAGTTDFYGTPASPSLLDALPAFMGLSAALARAVSDWNITPRWMALAAESMLQAVLEQYLVYGASGTAPLDEAFAWGLNRGVTEESDDEEQLVNTMFQDEEDPEREVEGWKEVREEYRQALIPPVTTPLLAHLDTLALQHPLANYEDSVLAFLHALLASQPAPLLTQLEAGQVEGLTRQETEALKARAGFGG